MQRSDVLPSASRTIKESITLAHLRYLAPVKRHNGLFEWLYPDCCGTVKHGFSRVQIAKSDVSTVDYLRMKPATDELELALEEAPYALGFYPEFYLRALGLEGRVHVRLYDAAKPEDDRTFGIKICSD